MDKTGCIDGLEPEARDVTDVQTLVAWVSESPARF
jgi:hypothetical protein